MIDNHIYNLLIQMVQEHKSLWRIKNMYKEDAKSCQECSKIWEEIENSKEEISKKLEKLIKSHI